MSIPLSGEVKLSIGNEGRSELGFEGGGEDGPVGIKKGFQTRNIMSKDGIGRLLNGLFWVLVK